MTVGLKFHIQTTLLQGNSGRPCHANSIRILPLCLGLIKNNGWNFEYFPQETTILYNGKFLAVERSQDYAPTRKRRGNNTISITIFIVLLYNIML